MIEILINTNTNDLTENEKEITSNVFSQIDKILSESEYAKENLVKEIGISPTGISERTMIKVLDRKNKNLNSQYLEVAYEIKNLVTSTPFYQKKIFATVM